MIINLPLSLYQIRIFLDRYGASVNGLIQTGNQSLSYLSLIESGMCAVFLYYMYKPMAERKNEELSALYAGFDYSMRQIVIKMIVIAFLISLIFPLFIQDKSIPLFDMISILGILSIRYITPYYLTLAPKYMVILKEKNYLVELIDGVQNNSILIINIFLLKYFAISVQVILLINAIVVFGIGLVYRKLMRHEYGSLLMKSEFKDTRPMHLRKYFFAHNISSLVFNSSGNVVLSVFAPSLSFAFIYSSYNRISAQAISFITKIVDGTRASIGLMMWEDNEKTYHTFKILQAIIQLCSIIIVSVYIFCINDFIDLWIGSEFILKPIDVFLFGALLYANGVLTTYYIVHDAKGLYKESQNFTIFQSVLNVILMLILVPYMGITGVLIASCCGRYLVGIIQYEKLTYTLIFPAHKKNLFAAFIPILLIVASVFLSNFLFTNLSFLHLDNRIYQLIILFIVSLAISSIISCLYFFLFNQTFQTFLRKQFSEISRKIKKRL